MKSTVMKRLRTGYPEVGGWGRFEYTDWIDESLSWKKDCYVGDWSFLDELHVEGPDALRLFSDFCVNSFEKFGLGQAKHVIACNTAGKVIGEGILMRLGEQKFEFQALGPVTDWFEYNCKKGDYAALATIGRAKFKFQVSGPKALYLLEELTQQGLRDIKFMHVKNVDMKLCDARFLRQGMAGEIGFEIQGPLEQSREAMKVIMAVGGSYNVRRLGTRTAMINHLEACFPTVTHDYLPAVCEPDERDFYEYVASSARRIPGRMWTLDGCLKVKGSFEADDVSAWYRSPVELAWARNIKFDHDFYGRAALEVEVASPKRKIVTLEWNGEDCADVQSSLYRGDEQPYDFMDMPRQHNFGMNAHKVLKDDQPVGVATSRSFSIYFRKMLSHCVIDIAHSAPGTPVTVIWGDPGTRQREIRATVAPSPYKKDNRKADIAALPDKLPV